MKSNYLKVMLVTFLSAFLLCSCAQFGLQGAQGVDQEIGYAYSSVTAIRSSTASSLESGAISVKVSQDVLSLTDGVRSALDLAKIANASGDQATALSKLSAATQVISQIQTYIHENGVK